jgi:CheY-like chemotaxis protein
MTTQLAPDFLRDWSVLIVDDEEDSLEVARYLLEFYGATVHVAGDGREGLEKAKSIRPDFIISDISMPRVDGWQMIDQIKRDRTLMEIPVIALTAHALRGDRERALSAGFHNYLTKPLTVTTFIRDLLLLLTDIPAMAQRLPPDMS